MKTFGSLLILWSLALRVQSMLPRIMLQLMGLASPPPSPASRPISKKKQQRNQETARGDTSGEGRGQKK